MGLLKLNVTEEREIFSEIAKNNADRIKMFRKPKWFSISRACHHGLMKKMKLQNLCTFAYVNATHFPPKELREFCKTIFNC